MKCFQGPDEGGRELQGLIEAELLVFLISGSGPAWGEMVVAWRRSFSFSFNSVSTTGMCTPLLVSSLSSG